MRTVWSQMVSSRRRRMRIRNVEVVREVEHFAGNVQQLEVHHVIHNDLRGSIQDENKRRCLRTKKSGLLLSQLRVAPTLAEYRLASKSANDLTPSSAVWFDGLLQGKASATSELSLGGWKRTAAVRRYMDMQGIPCRGQRCLPS